jgi:hypothetical protein
MQFPNLSLSCFNRLCIQPRSSKRIHASCLWCVTRKAQYDKQFTYDKFFGLWLPKHFDVLTTVLINGNGYMIFYNERRMFAHFKQPLLLFVFNRAEHCIYSKISKRLYLIAEFLAS